MSQRYSSLDEVIQANNLAKDSKLSPEEIRHWAKMAMITHSLAYILADAAESFLMDSEEALAKFDKNLVQKTKQNFRELHRCISASRAAAKRAAAPIYETTSGYTDDACIDSDWWYNFVKLLDDRVGVNPQKNQMLLEFLLQMPSEGEGLFNPKFEDFVKAI